MSNRLRLMVGLPAYGDSLTAHQARMWMEFGSTISGSVERFELVDFMHVDVNPIDKARNLLLGHAISRRADWLLMIDADTWAECNTPDEDAGVQILRMISDADRRDATIVCAPVVRRRMERSQADSFMVYKLPESGLWTDQLVAVERSELIFNGRHLIPIDACATACFAVNLPRLAKLREARPDLSSIRFTFNAELALSEDIDFCRQVKQAGGEIYCDPRVRTGHKSRPFALYSR